MNLKGGRKIARHCQAASVKLALSRQVGWTWVAAGDPLAWQRLVSLNGAPLA